MSIQKFCKTLIYFTVLICPQFFKEHQLMILNYGSYYLHNVQLFTIFTSYASFCIYITSFNAKVTSQLHFQGSRPFACHICGKSFNMLSSLKVHEHIHVPVKKKPYPCDLCHRLNPFNHNNIISFTCRPFILGISIVLTVAVLNYFLYSF